MSKIIGVGSYLPGLPISNEDLSKIVPNIDSEWIRSRTGIMQRHFASEGEYTSHLATKAAIRAIEDAKISPNDLDLIIVATTTPDSTFPSVAAKVQAELKITKQIPSFDLQAVCAGFIYSMETAEHFLKSGKYKNILIIGAERMSSVLDMNDRNSTVLFGDGAGAVIVTQSENKIISKIYADGSFVEILYTSGGVASTKNAGIIQMNGREVFRHAIEKMANSIEELLKENNLTSDSISWLVPHQANLRIIDGIATRLKFPDENIVKTVAQHANTSAASIPLALETLKKSGKLKSGDLILMTGLGAGLTWGSLLIKW